MTLLPRTITGVFSRFSAILALACWAVNAGAQDSGSENGAALDAGVLVERADRIRFPRESFETLVTVTNREDGETSDLYQYKVMSQGNDNTIVITESPASERGQKLLMRGRDLWIFMPSVSQPVRLSLSQRLTGQVANGDLARANFAGDYDAELVGSDSIDGADTHILELTAAARGVTYARVRYWIRADNNYPVKAEFYAVSGRLLKTCRYENFRELAGGIRPTRLVIEDALDSGKSSVMEYQTMALQDFPERWFTKEYLRRLD